MFARRMEMALRLLRCALLALLLGSSVGMQDSSAHDFGGPTNPGDEDDDDEDPPCDSDPCCDGPDDGDGDGGEDPSGRTDSPISYYDGSESLTIADLTIRGAFPIRLIRKYDSNSSYDSPLGYGWAFLHDRRLYEYPDGSVVIRHGCGTRDKYIYSGGAYVSPTGGTLATVVEQPDGSFVVKYLNGFTDYFDSHGRLTAHQNRQGNRHEFTYDPRGKLPLVGTSSQAVDPTQPMVVAQLYRLTRIEERTVDGALTGRFVTLDYNETTGRITTVTANDGRSVTYQMDVSGALTRGNLVQVAGLENIVSSYEYNDPNDIHNLTSITAEQGRLPVINVYDAQDRVIRQDEGTRRTEFNFAVPYQRTVVTQTIRDQNGLNPYTALTTYEFDVSGRITKVIDALGHETRYQYSPSKRLTSKEQWQNNAGTLSLLQSKNWTYDSAGHKTSQSVTLDAGGTITKSWTYDHDWIASEQTVASFRPQEIFRTEYTFHYGPDGRPINIQSEKRRTESGAFLTTSYAYDSRNRLQTITLPDAVQIAYEYQGDFVSRVYFVTNGSALAEGEQRFEFDSRGFLASRRDARNNLTQYLHDDLGRVTQVTNALNEQTLLSYLGEKLSEIEVGRTAGEGEGQVSRMVYDGRSRLTGLQRKNDAGSFVNYRSYQLDSEGRPLTRADALGHTTSLAYDLLGRLRQVIDPAGKQSTIQYDAAGNRIRTLDAENREVRYEYDDLGRLLAAVEFGVTPNPRTEYGYDAVGNIVSLTDAEGQTTVYSYDALSRPVAITKPLGQSVQFSYDLRDRLAFLINGRGQKIAFDYESWGPLSEERHYSSASSTTPTRTISFDRDSEGNTLSVIDNAIQSTPIYSFTHDALNRMYDETVKYVPGGDRVLRHRYDRYGNRNELTLQDATSITNTYTYNKLDQLVAASLGGAALQVTNYANGDRHRVELPNGVSEAFTYYDNGPVQAMAFEGPAGPLASFAYTYNNVRDLLTETDEYGTHSFAHDGLQRLTGVTRPAAAGLPNESFAYDRVGNREDPANAAVYQYDDNNQLLASPGLTYTFDADSSMQTSSDGATFSHDVRNRLVQYSKGPLVVDYLYDVSGRRLRKSIGTASTWFVWDQNRLLAEYDSAGNRKQSYGYLDYDYVPTQIRNSNGTYYVHPDHLHTPRFISDANADVVWRAKSHAFGETVLDVDQDGQGAPVVVLNHRLPGQYFDEETGLHYNLQRYFDPQTGRYIEADPFGLAAGFNLFAYAKNSPGMVIDPEGTQPQYPNPRNPRVPRGGNRNADAYEYMARRYREEQELPPWLKEPPPPRLPPPLPNYVPPGFDKEFRDNLGDFYEEGWEREKDRLQDEADKKIPDPKDYPFPPPPDGGVCRADDDKRREEHERRKKEWAEQGRRQWHNRCDWCK